MKDFKYLDVVNLPSDPSGSLGKFRTGLLLAYNSNRSSPEKLELLAKTLTCVVEQINAGIEMPDVNTEAFLRWQIDKEIAATSTTAGFEPIQKPKPKPKRAAKRTPTKAGNK